jgi:hypothetical protein
VVRYTCMRKREFMSAGASGSKVERESYMRRILICNRNSSIRARDGTRRGQQRA